MRHFRTFGLQFFASDGAGQGADPAAQGVGTTDQGIDPTGGDDGAQQQAQQGRTFTQEEVNQMLAREKRQGKTSVLKALGLDPNDKDAEKKAKVILDQHKTQQQLDQEALTREKEARQDAEGKATAAERKYLTLVSGCKKEYIDEVMALAGAKVTENVSYEDALKAVKEKCPVFFDDADAGTGSGQGHRRQQQGEKPGSLGARLAQNLVSNMPKENPYFKN